MIDMEPPALNPLPQFPENSYKMTEEDVKRLIEFRASNEALFTGKRNSAKIAWSTILKGLGLEGKLTADQIAKKWDNLRTKYKDLKQPYQGQDHIGGVVESWPWFHIMDEAMQGRLYNSNLVLSPENAGNAAHRTNSQPSQTQENTDILEFLIKTEMEDTVTAETAEDDGTVHAEAAPIEGVPMGWRRMSECSYKMTEPETERMIKLRAANEALFTGRKHSAKPAWRAILYELGLQGKLTTDQLAKKWDNLKRRYKELKFPARGVETNPSSWPWFYRMNDAMEGRFTGAAPILTPIVEDEDEDCEPLSSTPKKRARRSRGGMAEFLTESEMDLLVDNEEKNGSTALGELHRMAEFTYKLTEDDTRRLIELRAANESLFTGRRNTAKPAWRGIVKEMGLTGKITPDQVAKKWDNLKTKFKDLKFPPRGMEGQTNPASWPWFQLMSDALEGRLVGKAPRVTPVWTNEEDGVFGSSPPADRDCLMAERGSVSELESMVGGDNAEADGNVTYIDASGEECSTLSDLTYKMTDQDTRKMIKLRAANEALFTGRRNAAKAAWKAILKELGLQGKVSTYQMAKKWDNLKRRYKDLKYPPVGMESVADGASSWPWFHLMNEAMEGRLASSAPLLTPVTQDDDQHPDPAPDTGPAPCHPLLLLPPPPPRTTDRTRSPTLRTRTSAARRPATGRWAGWSGSGRWWRGRGRRWSGRGRWWRGTGRRWRGTGRRWRGTGRRCRPSGCGWTGRGRRWSGTGPWWSRRGRCWAGRGRFWTREP
uniref:Myb/SANT-like DNA-binding domain-containing protein n=1 Tax=Amphiprion percula TaxID=161767 RepID=A0A3P8RSS4_AMPPE